jgi:hypothetical protein
MARGMTTVRMEREEKQGCVSGAGATTRPDLLRRFTPTPHVSHLRLMKRTVRLETNSLEIQHMALRFFQNQGGVDRQPDGQPELLWRVIGESQSGLPSTNVPVTAFADSGLQYVNFGQRSFLALDLDKRQAIAFLSDCFVEANPRLRHRPPLDILLSMTVASLGLVALSAACVGWQDRGVLVFGPPNSGKTTASYLAASTLGCEFVADQVVFLDMRSGRLEAWGDPFPAVFRPQTLTFLPELRRQTHPSAYAEHSFFYFEKDHFQAPHAYPVTPLCSIFLDRNSTGEAAAVPVPETDFLRKLQASSLFREDARFDPQLTTALSNLAGLPAFEFRYGSNPKVAAVFIQEILRGSWQLT